MAPASGPSAQISCIRSTHRPGTLHSADARGLRRMARPVIAAVVLVPAALVTLAVVVLRRIRRD